MIEAHTLEIWVKEIKKCAYFRTFFEIKLISSSSLERERKNIKRDEIIEI